MTIIGFMTVVRCDGPGCGRQVCYGSIPPDDWVIDTDAMRWQGDYCPEHQNMGGISRGESGDG